MAISNFFAFRHFSGLVVKTERVFFRFILTTPVKYHGQTKNYSTQNKRIHSNSSETNLLTIWKVTTFAIACPRLWQLRLKCVRVICLVWACVGRHCLRASIARKSKYENRSDRGNYLLFIFYLFMLCISSYLSHSCGDFWPYGVRRHCKLPAVDTLTPKASFQLTNHVLAWTWIFSMWIINVQAFEFKQSNGILYIHIAHIHRDCMRQFRFISLKWF